ncbi:Bifunctional inhibitor/plant lipid transfer protein/seed storage helical domain [Dillenia turbinata]|uniref:Bifunctional inhibitor/plant lipid transfer protein/seed storage helical domain n=1 Tax=Dillenia turbinata TaxID=194707 RepID=A0AAN8YYX9_9MAGN
MGRATTKPKSETPNGYNQRMFTLCCQKLGQISEECRCLAILKMVTQLEERFMGGDTEAMLRRAQILPSTRKMGPHRCDITFCDLIY